MTSCFCDAENSIFIDETEFEIALCCRRKTVVLKKQTEESRDSQRKKITFGK